MTDAIDPIRRASGDRRIRGRRKTDGADQAGEAAGAQAPSGAALVAPVAPVSPASEIPEPILSAQLLGEASPPTPKPPQQARAAYLEVEWSGGADRRARRGRIAKTDV
jgi:hypothetical protein